ncbi:MAG: hypothetical protein ACREDC_01020 [Bradyrhizobium sp.]
MIGMRREILLLATRTHWSRQEILALPRAEFDFYIAELVKSEQGED